MASVGHLREVPGRDLWGPAGDGATEFVDLGWAGLVLEVVGELEGVSERDGGAVDVVDASYGFGGVPGCADFSMWVTGVEEAAEAGAAPVADAFVGCGEEPAYPIQRVGFAAPVPEGFVLDPATDFVEPLVGEADHMEWVCDLPRVGQDPVVGWGRLSGCTVVTGLYRVDTDG